MADTLGGHNWTIGFTVQATTGANLKQAERVATNSDQNPIYLVPNWRPTVNATRRRACRCSAAGAGRGPITERDNAEQAYFQGTDEEYNKHVETLLRARGGLQAAHRRGARRRRAVLARPRPRPDRHDHRDGAQVCARGREGPHYACTLKYQYAAGANYVYGNAIDLLSFLLETDFFRRAELDQRLYWPKDFVALIREAMVPAIAPAEAWCAIYELVDSVLRRAVKARALHGEHLAGGQPPRPGL